LLLKIKFQHNSDCDKYAALNVATCIQLVVYWDDNNGKLS